MTDTSRLLPIKLTDQAGTEKLLLLAEGDKSITETYVNPENLWKPGTPTPYSDFDPAFAHITQRTWVGGRGLEIFDDDPTRFYDGSAWTLSPGKLFPALQWKRAEGICDDEFSLPGNVVWKNIGTTGSSARATFTAATTFTAQRLYIWTGKVVGVAITEVTATINVTGESEIEKNILIPDGTSAIGDRDFSEFCYADLNSLSIESGDTVQINVATDDTTGTYRIATVTGGNDMYYLLVGTATNRKWLFFNFKNALYAVDSRDDGTASTLLINGDRGRATAGSTSTTLENTARTWTADQWIGAWVYVWDGTGAGQRREITDNSTTVLTVAAWDVTPDATSQYVIYKTPYWTSASIGTTGLGKVLDVTVANGIVYFAQGESVNVRRMKWSDTSHTYADDGTLKAKLIRTISWNNGEQVAYVKDSDGNTWHAPTQPWGTQLAATSWGNTGTTSFYTNIIQHEGSVYFFKEESAWSVDPGGKTKRILPDYGSMPQATNGQAAVSRSGALYFNWISSMERLVGSTLDDIDPNRDAGLPDNRRGVISAMISHPAGIILSIDGGGSNYSSIQFWDGGGFHEIMRAPMPGWRIRNVALQGNPDTNPFLWFDMNGDVYYIMLPKQTINPLEDSTVNYMHESVLDTATFDLSARTLKKLFKEFSVISKSLSADAQEVSLYYQSDANVGTSTWTAMNVEDYDTSPYQSETFPLPSGGASYGLGDVHAVRLRLKFYTNTSTTPPVVEAYTLKGFARVPLKKMWTIRVKLADWIQRKGGTAPTTFLDWLDTKASSCEVLRMESEHYRLDDVDVIPVPQIFHTSRIDINNNTFDGVLVLVLREL